jgi:triacylglycerol lipase
VRSVLRSHLVIVALVAAMVGVLPAPAHAARYTPSSNPVLLVHGWASSASSWDTMVGRFRADGWPANYVRAFSYNTAQSNATTAAQVRSEVDKLLAATGKSKVDLISHSMGGLSTRYYVKYLGGGAKVDRFVSLGGPNHGTNTASVCPMTSCAEMRVGSTFLANLNSGDETPGSPTYGTWRSPCDLVINPVSSTSLSGAQNTSTACIGHNTLQTDGTVYAQTRDFVNP